MFWMFCGGLLLLGVGLLWLPLGHRREEVSSEQANLAWFELREQELSIETGDRDTLERDAKLRLLEDSAGGLDPAPSEAGRFQRWWLAPPIAVLALLLYFQTGAITDVQISRTLNELDTEVSEEQFAALTERLERRLVQRPEKVEYLQLLGRLYMGRGRYPEAALAYQRLVGLEPDDPQVLAQAAQASYLAADRRLDSQARRYAEQALAVSPHQRTALGLLGMEAYERGDYQTAIRYWERLLAVEPAESGSATMIAGILASAREKLAGKGAANATDADPDQSPLAVDVRIALAPGVEVAASDTVYVSLRNPAIDSRMPLAVTRLGGAQLPTTLRLDESHVIGGQSLASVSEVMVVVLVSPSGRPGVDNASLMAEVGPVKLGSAGGPVLATLVPPG